MAKRADDVAETRQRIVDATTTLHGTVGPARTTIAGIAEAAGVTRVTVYRHFPDEDALFAACSANWLAQQPHHPDPSAWEAIPDPAARLRTALAEVYAFFRHGAPTLTLLYTDWSVLPAGIQDGLRGVDAARRDVLLQAFARRTKRLRAVLGHAVSFGTWRSLCLEQGLSDKDAVEAMATLALSTAGLCQNTDNAHSTASAMSRTG